MSGFLFTCPHCNQQLDAPPELMGQNIECPTCKGAIQLPEPEPTVPEPVGQPQIVPLQRPSLQPVTQTGQKPPSRNPATKQCPYCAETILAAAIKCKHCKADLRIPPSDSLAANMSKPAVATMHEARQSITKPHVKQSSSTSATKGNRIDEAISWLVTLIVTWTVVVLVVNAERRYDPSSHAFALVLVPLGIIVTMQAAYRFYAIRRQTLSPEKSGAGPTSEFPATSSAGTKSLLMVKRIAQIALLGFIIYQFDSCSGDVDEPVAPSQASAPAPSQPKRGDIHIICPKCGEDFHTYTGCANCNAQHCFERHYLYPQCWNCKTIISQNFLHGKCLTEIRASDEAHVQIR